MPRINASFFRDNNNVPLNNAFVTQTTQSLTANNTTASNAVFSITGTVEVLGLWAVVTTVLSSNITAAHWRLNDQTATPAITLATGTTLSSAAAGGVIVKKGLAAAALVFLDAAAGVVSEPTTLETPYFSPFVVVQKTGSVTTTIDFRYTTTNTPATGALQFFVRWLPVSATAAVTAL